MNAYSTLKHSMMGSIAWRPDQPAECINDHILMSRSTSNAYVVTSDDGDVVINTATVGQGARTRERFEQLLGRKLAVSKIVFTQSHPDHIGGWEFFAGPGVETVVQRAFPQICQERKMLGPFFTQRNARVLAALLSPTMKATDWFTARDPDPLTLFADDTNFEVGGRRFELISTPSGETLDALCVWLPAEKTLFTGNLMGAIYGALPNFYTARGDRDRSVTGFMHDIARLIALQPELLITGHDAPTRGAAQVHADLTKLLEATRFIHDYTVEGMNAQKTLDTLMRDVVLPEHLQMVPGRGPASWYVRAVWEEYAGWFRQDSTTELYAVPPASVWPELAAMAGGAAALTDHARAHVAAGRPVEALHLLEIALTAEPGHRGALETQLAALQLLVERNQGRFFDELGWLEGQIMATEQKLKS